MDDADWLTFVDVAVASCHYTEKISLFDKTDLQFILTGVLLTFIIRKIEFSRNFQFYSRKMALTNGGEAKKKVALITGITGQDGSYLAELLIEKGYEVHGIIRRSSSFNTGRISHLYDDPNSHKEGKMKLHYGDLIDGSCLVKIISKVRPCEIYNLAAQSHVQVSFEMPEYTAEVVAVGTLRLLDAIKTCGLEKSVKFYQASTSELYGKPNF